VIADTVNTASRLQRLTRLLETPLVVGDTIVRAGAALGWCGAIARAAQGPWRAGAARPQRARPYLDSRRPTMIDEGHVSQRACRSGYAGYNEAAVGVYDERDDDLAPRVGTGLHRTP
jgi:hypothetical protein